MGLSSNVFKRTCVYEYKKTKVGVSFGGTISLHFWFCLLSRTSPRKTWKTPTASTLGKCHVTPGEKAAFRTSQSLSRLQKTHNGVKVSQNIIAISNNNNNNIKNTINTCGTITVFLLLNLQTLKKVLILEAATTLKDTTNNNDRNNISTKGKLKRLTVWTVTDRSTHNKHTISTGGPLVPGASHREPARATDPTQTSASLVISSPWRAAKSNRNTGISFRIWSAGNAQNASTCVTMDVG